MTALACRAWVCEGLNVCSCAVVSTHYSAEACQEAADSALHLCVVQGRGLVAPSTREWDLALTKLRRIVDNVRSLLP